MGDICPCPCPRRRKHQDYPYDVHEETFEIEEKSGTLDDSSPKETVGDNNVLTDELRTSQQSNDRSPFDEKNSTPESRELKQKGESHEQLISTNFAMSAEKQQLMKPQEPPKPVEEPPKFHANILKAKTIKKKYNPDDYRFKDQTDSFKVKKIDSIKEQQYNIDNCKNSSYFIFDITANVYIDDCQNCIIFIAPCESTIFVRNCKKLTIIAVTGQFRTYECHECTFSLYCKSQPVIESSSDLVFTSFSAPIYYEQLTQQSQKKKFEPWNNHWSDIHNFTKKEGEQHHQLKESIDLSHIDWKRAFDEAELPIAEIENPFPLIMGQLPYQPQKQLLILFNPDIDNSTALKILKGAVILKGNCGVLQGEGKNIKKVVLIDSLDFMPEKYEQLGTVFTDPEQIQKKKQQWFISFGDSRQK